MDIEAQMNQSFVRSIAFFVIASALVLTAAVRAQNKGERENEAPGSQEQPDRAAPFGKWGQGPQFDGQARNRQQWFDTGLVFIEGEFVPGPYEVAMTAEGVTINGKVVPSAAPNGFRFANTDNADNDGRGGSRRGQHWQGFGRRFGQMNRVVDCLDSNGVLVAFGDEPLVTLVLTNDVYAFFSAIATRDATSPARQQLFQQLPRSANRGRWADWLAEYTPPDEVQTMGVAYVESYNAIEKANMAEVAAVQRISKLSYPLTVFGMVAGVLALGHLLTSLPRADASATSEGVRPEWVRATVISVALVIVLSMLDLVWTILGHQSGQMQELNPFGSRLIENPQLLIAFKTTATLVSCGLLLALRRHHIARKAAWWACLVLTVLTFRWLVFNSMFIV